MRNREQYLQSVVTHFRRDLKKVGITVPPVHISVGMTGQGRTIGLTYARLHSPDNCNQIFLTPEISDTDDAIGVVAHEVVHAILDCEYGHGREFTLLARHLGLTKPYAVVTAGPILIEKMKKIRSSLGKYPHPGFTFLDTKPTKCGNR